MRKTLLALSALGMIALASCKSGNISGKIDQKWQVLFDKSDDAKRDSLYNAQMQSLDTLTSIPAEFLDMKKQLAAMPKDSLATIPPYMIEMLNFSDLNSFKEKMKASMIQSKKQDDSLMNNRVVIYDFSQGGMVKMYATDNPNMSDTTTMFKANLKKKKVFMYGNPAVYKGEMAHDTVVFDILYLSKDSLSLQMDSTKTKNTPRPSMKPMNFKRYKEPKK